MSDQQTKFRHVSDEQRFVAEMGDERVGSIDYVIDGPVFDFTHTETDPAHQGGGIAGELTRSALDTVRTLGLSVRPSCHYTAGWIERHPGYADLLAG